MDLSNLLGLVNRVLACLVRAASTLFFLRQKQVYPIANGFCSRNAMRFTVIIKAFRGFIVKPNFYIVSLGIFRLWSSGSWRHFITSLFGFHKFIIINGTQKVKLFLLSIEDY